MRINRSVSSEKICFVFIIIIAFFLSTMAGFKIASKSGYIQDKKIIANKEKVVPTQKRNIKKTGAAESSPEEKLSLNTKVVYLTFDDGPSADVTPKILDILKKNNIKATFFVVGSMAEKHPDLLKREKAEGHVIGNHTYSHNYAYLYSNKNNFLDDLKKNEDVINSIIGKHDKKLIRFPGGSFGRTQYKRSAEKNGYIYIDWNEETGDGESVHPTVDMLVNKFKRYDNGQKRMVVLMHDAASKQATEQALPVVIKILKDEGYTFKPITSGDYGIMEKLFRR